MFKFQILLSLILLTSCTETKNAPSTASEVPTKETTSKATPTKKSPVAEKADFKTIEITEKSFSDVYPAVLFNPSNGKIESLTRKNQDPANGFNIRIEPSDPEWSSIGITIKLGEGKSHFENPVIPETLPKSTGNIFSKRDPMKEHVFYYKNGSVECLFMFLEVDRKKEIVKFLWKKI
jgi:hypothetical protein